MDRSRKKGQITKAESILGSLVPGRRWQVYLPRRVIWERWEDVVGSAVASSSWPWYFRDLDCLVVAVSDSIWMQQLSFESPVILERLNRLLPQNARLKRVEFRIADVDKIRSDTLARPKRDKKRDAAPKEKQRICKADEKDPELELVKALDDPELKESFRHLFSLLKGERNHR